MGLARKEKCIIMMKCTVKADDQVGEKRKGEVKYNQKVNQNLLKKSKLETYYHHEFYTIQ